MTRRLVLGVLCVMALVGAGTDRAAAQDVVVIDRILSRAYGELLTSSDVWRAIDLHLLPLDEPTLASVQTALENRRLILREVNRLPASEPSAAALASQRRAWEARWAPGVDPGERLNRAGMTEAALAAWFRDEARIASHLDQRFAATPEAERPAAIGVWVNLLRQRAGLQ